MDKHKEVTRVHNKALSNTLKGHPLAFMLDSWLFCRLIAYPQKNIASNYYLPRRFGCIAEIFSSKEAKLFCIWLRAVLISLSWHKVTVFLFPSIHLKAKKIAKKAIKEIPVLIIWQRVVSQEMSHYVWISYESTGITLFPFVSRFGCLPLTTWFFLLENYPL